LRTDSTYLGAVRRVVGAKLSVEIDPALPSANPIIDGHVHRLGQVGSFVRIPLGHLNLYAIVTTVGASEAPENTESEWPLPEGRRWIEVQLVGESYGRGPFQRGVSVYPTLDDEVHVVTAADLAIVYRTHKAGQIEIGRHSASESLPATIDIDAVVTRHVAVLGSTGSGKSNCVAAILKALADERFPSARVAVIDTHGEYGAAFPNVSRVLRIGDAEHPLTVPYWVMAYDELSWFLVGRTAAVESVQDGHLRQAIFEAKREQCRRLKAGTVNPEEITADSPIPFDLRHVWYELDKRDRATYEDEDRTILALSKVGNAQSLTPAEFKPPAPGMKAPHLPRVQLGMASYLNRIVARLKDRRFDFLLSPGTYDGIKLDIHDLIGDWVDHEQPITVFDLAGVPPEVIDVVVAVITRILFESMFWGRDLPGTGRQRPILLVYEEAHSYLPRGESRFVAGYARRAVQRVFKEGRKYGVGAVVVSQRPSELDEGILSQCGTFVALRLSNTDDQGRVRSTVPDSLGGLVELLPALRTGEALVLGEAVAIPSRVRLPLVEPRPKSDDPEVAKRWMDQRIKSPPYSTAVTAWRRQRPAVPDSNVSEENGG